jgi:hypothetical protein
MADKKKYPEGISKTDKEPEGIETITPSLIAKAGMEGEKFQPQNEAQERLKKELAALRPRTVIDVPNDFDF